MYCESITRLTADNTGGFARLRPENVNEVFQSLIKMGDVAHSLATSVAVDDAAERDKEAARHHQESGDDEPNHGDDAELRHRVKLDGRRLLHRR